MRNIFGLIVSIIFIGLVLVCGKVFEKAGKEASRKFIHIMLSNWWIIAMIFFDNVWMAAILPFLFVIINYISYKFNIINLDTVPNAMVIMNIVRIISLRIRM